MGYETELLIGFSTSLIDDEYEKGALTVEDYIPYYPYIKDERGQFIRTGRKRTFFQIIATVDLSKYSYALKQDMAKDNYRRFKWALALLESMQNETQEITVLLYGH